jgi:hypothetical protein
MILVLGSNGFLGKRVCHKLKEKEIPYIGTSFSIGVDLREKDQTFKLFEKVKPTYVINCASYVGGIQFYIHSERDVSIQIGNLYMSFAWYLFFSTISLLYYYICNRLLQRSEQIRDWLKRLKKKYRNQKLELEHEDCDFYKEYNLNYGIIKNFAKYWNFLIFIGFILLLAHIPIDFISIVYEKVYFDIPGLIIKTGALAWYLYCICQLNDYEDKIIPYLYKHRIYTDNQIEYISKYIKYRPL